VVAVSARSSGRRVRRRSGLGVEVGAALNLIGAIVKYLSVPFLVPAAVALGYSEPAWPFLIPAAAAAAVGLVLERLTAGREAIGAREGFLVVALAWLVAAFFVSLPYVLAEPQLRRPVDAYFEAMSGMTTTGASMLTDVPALDRSLAMWRQLSQWLGGMGIVVLALAVLPRLQVGGRQLLETELPGPESQRLTARIRDTARRLWLLYVGLTGVLAALLAVFGWTGLDDEMNVFDAVAHAFTTLPTGGFSTRARGVEEFGAATQWAIVVFMAVAGANFALMYRAFVHRRARVLFRDEELRVYVALLALGSLVLAVELLGQGLFSGEAAVRHAIFQTVSMMTTTGYASVDFNLWLTTAPLAALALVALMFPGGSAGSTAGSIKVVRHLMIARILRRDVDQTVHPSLVSPIRLNSGVVDERTLRAVVSFVLLYVGIFVAGAIALLIDSTRAGVALSPFEAIAAAATTLGNVGPAFGFAGPMGSFEPFSDVSTGIMIVLMWLGRLEIIPVVALFTRSYWRA
jgi:trk system potassium uptake protein TrkH